MAAQEASLLSTSAKALVSGKNKELQDLRVEVANLKAWKKQHISEVKTLEREVRSAKAEKERAESAEATQKRDNKVMQTQMKTACVRQFVRAHKWQKTLHRINRQIDTITAQLRAGGGGQTAEAVQSIFDQSLTIPSVDYQEAMQRSMQPMTAALDNLSSKLGMTELVTQEVVGNMLQWKETAASFFQRTVELTAEQQDMQEQQEAERALRDREEAEMLAEEQRLRVQLRLASRHSEDSNTRTPTYDTPKSAARKLSPTAENAASKPKAKLSTSVDNEMGSAANTSVTTPKASSSQYKSRSVTSTPTVAKREAGPERRRRPSLSAPRTRSVGASARASGASTGVSASASASPATGLRRVLWDAVQDDYDAGPAAKHKATPASAAAGGDGGSVFHIIRGGKAGRKVEERSATRRRRNAASLDDTAQHRPSSSSMAYRSLQQPKSQSAPRSRAVSAAGSPTRTPPLSSLRPYKKSGLGNVSRNSTGSNSNSNSAGASHTEQRIKARHALFTGGPLHRAKACENTGKYLDLPPVQ